MCGLAVFLIILALALVVPASWMMGVVHGVVLGKNLGSKNPVVIQSN